MITPQGFVALFAGIAALVVGRVFAIVELFVIGAALFLAVAVAVAYVALRRPRAQATRWIHPSVLVAGDTGRVDVHLTHDGALPSAACVLVERVRRSSTDDQVARLPIPPMRAGTRTTTGYRLPSARRGITELGPLQVEVRDPLGIAVSSRIVAGLEQVVVAPRALALDMPQLGQGLLGAALLDRARRLGPGDFHGLREYQDGDEPRSIHWKASARNDELMVKEHTVEGLHRCTVLLDAGPGAHADEDAFERAVTAAASVVNSAARAGLTTRFVTGSIDLRGPEVAMTTMRVLARIEAGSEPATHLERDPAEGLGLLVVVCGSRHGAAWRLAHQSVDPTTTLVAITTSGDRPTRMSVGAATEDDLVIGWQSLVGRGRLDLLERQ